MDIMQMGRMLWVWVQNHDKMVMIADVSVVALIKKWRQSPPNCHYSLPFQNRAILKGRKLLLP
jgi:hypothetical protein